MESNTLVKFVIVVLAAVAVQKIFGTKTLAVLVSIIAVLLFLIYKNQNKLLYMPGNKRWT